MGAQNLHEQTAAAWTPVPLMIPVLLELLNVEHWARTQSYATYLYPILPSPRRPKSDAQRYVYMPWSLYCARRTLVHS